jgi:CrcB protein
MVGSLKSVGRYHDEGLASSSRRVSSLTALGGCLNVNHIALPEGDKVTTLVWIMLGGALGTGARYLVSNPLNGSTAEGYPYGTLAVNLLGCLAIGFLATALTEVLVRDELKLALLVGCLGGFTTFSSFGLETVSLMQHGRFAAALSYVLISNVCGLALAWVGFKAAGALA